MHHTNRDLHQALSLATRGLGFYGYVICVHLNRTAEPQKDTGVWVIRARSQLMLINSLFNMPLFTCEGTEMHWSVLESWKIKPLL